MIRSLNASGSAGSKKHDPFDIGSLRFGHILIGSRGGGPN
jgi:hypothetical protein